MSDHLDPIRRLETFDSGGVTMTPIAPSEIRRLGNRRRARRRTATVLAAAAATLAVVVPLGIALGNGSEDGAPPITRTPSPTPSATGSSAPPSVVTYPAPGVMVRTAADTSELTGTSAAFRTFITGQAEKAAQEGASCPDADHGITVQKYSDAGYALGAYNACGGYAALWVLHGGAWQEGSGTQDVWDCDTLTYLRVPTSFAGACADEAGDFGPHEVAGLRLGMTQAQVEAAGGTLDPGPAHACRGLLLPHASAVPHQVDGYYSPTHGLVAISARPGMKTPEKIGLGSSLAAVRAAYPTAVQRIDYWVVPLGGTAEYEIGVEADRSVSELMLVDTRQDCFG